MTGRVVIISGVGTNIGRITATKFAQAGEQVMLVDTNDVEIKAQAEELRKAGYSAACVHVEHYDGLHIHNIIAETLDAYGRIDVLAHCVCDVLEKPFLDCTQDDFDNVMTQNLRATYLLNQAVAKHIIDQSAETTDGGVDQAHSGSIINVISTEAVNVYAQRALFAAAQGGIVQLTKALALTLAPYGARANAVAATVAQICGAEKPHPAKGTTPTQQIPPLNRRSRPDDIANAIFFLASQEAAFVTGQTITLDGGSGVVCPLSPSA